MLYKVWYAIKPNKPINHKSKQIRENQRGGWIRLMTGVCQDTARCSPSTIFYPAMRFGFVLFYGTSTILGHLIPNPFYIDIKYMTSKHILKITFLSKSYMVY